MIDMSWWGSLEVKHLCVQLSKCLPDRIPSTFDFNKFCRLRTVVCTEFRPSNYKNQPNLSWSLILVLEGLGEILASLDEATKLDDSHTGVVRHFLGESFRGRCPTSASEFDSPLTSHVLS